MKLISLLILIQMLFLGANTWAQGLDSEWFKSTRVEGFLSQTASYSSEHNFLSESQQSLSFDFWEAGVLLSTKVKSDLSFSSQLLGREVSEETGPDFSVGYAFFSHPLLRRPSLNINARLGRIRSSFGFYNDTRDIAHARTGAVMPQSIYYDMTRNSFYSSDGVELIFQSDINDEPISFQVLFSKPVEENEELKEASSLNPRNFDGDKGLLAKIMIGEEYDGWRFAFTYYRPEYKVDADFETQLFSDFGLDTLLPGVVLDATGSSFYSETMLSSVEYDALDWVITLEYSRHKFRAPLNTNVTRDLMSQMVPDPNDNSVMIDAFTAAQNNLPAGIFNQLLAFDELVGYEENFYLQGLYRFSEAWEAYTRFDYSQPHTGRHLSTGQKWQDINVGGTYRPDSNWLVRAELHYIEGTTRLLKRDNPGYEQLDQYWTAALLQVAYRW